MQVGSGCAWEPPFDFLAPVCKLQSLDRIILFFFNTLFTSWPDSMRFSVAMSLSIHKQLVGLISISPETKQFYLALGKQHF